MKRAKTDAELSLAAEEFLWEQPGLTEAHQWIFPRLIRWLEAEHVRNVLDLGCGNGAFTGALAEAGYDVVGVDMSESGIAVARRACPTVRLIQSDLDTPFPRELLNSFDAVLAVEVVEHLLLPRQVFQRAREALRPGGAFFVTTPYHSYWKNLALALAGKFDEHWHPLRDHGHVKFFSLQTLSQLFREQGFEVKQSARVGRVPPLACSMIMHGRKQ